MIFSNCTSLFQPVFYCRDEAKEEGLARENWGITGTQGTTKEKGTEEAKTTTETTTKTTKTRKTQETWKWVRIQIQYLVIKHYCTSPCSWGTLINWMWLIWSIISSSNKCCIYTESKGHIITVGGNSVAECASGPGEGTCLLIWVTMKINTEDQVLRHNKCALVAVCLSHYSMGTRGSSFWSWLGGGSWKIRWAGILLNFDSTLILGVGGIIGSKLAIWEKRADSELVVYQCFPQNETRTGCTYKLKKSVSLQLASIM